MTESSVSNIAATSPTYEKGKELARQIFTEVLAAIDVGQTMKRRIRRQGDVLGFNGRSFPLNRPPRVIAFGKAANRMAAVMHEILDGRVEAGVVSSPTDPAERIGKFRYFLGGHPYPNEGSFQAAQAALELAAGLQEDDCVLYLVSGGGSALLERPLSPDITLQDMEGLNRVLVGAGMPIEEMNVIRKHFSAIKGGRLGIQADPASRLTIYITDVPEQFPSMVASGPTLADESTLDECYQIAARYELAPKLPATIRDLFEKEKLQETPKPGDERLEKSHLFCLLANRDAVEAARAAAEKLGFGAEIDTGKWDENYREVGEAALARLEQLAQRHPAKPVCLIVGGEVTCPVVGSGLGGRNQHMVLHLTPKIAGRNRVFLSAGTDGKDGNSPAAGAVADGQTLGRADALGLDLNAHYKGSDSYHYFRSLGDVLETGYTDNNVRDLRLLLAFP